MSDHEQKRQNIMKTSFSLIKRSKMLYPEFKREKTEFASEIINASARTRENGVGIDRFFP